MSSVLDIKAVCILRDEICSAGKGQANYGRQANSPGTASYVGEKNVEISLVRQQ